LAAAIFLAALSLLAPFATGAASVLVRALDQETGLVHIHLHRIGIVPVAVTGRRHDRPFLRAEHRAVEISGIALRGTAGNYRSGIACHRPKS